MPVACTLGTLCFFAENKDFFAAVGSILVIGTLFIGLGSFSFAMCQYRSTQIWKRNEFLANEIKLFYSDKAVVDVEGMLDYNGESFIDGDGKNQITITVYHLQNMIQKEMPGIFYVNLAKALHHHSEGSVSEPELKIRKRFDIYFYYIQRFSIFIQNGLFTQKEIYPYLEYHISLLNGLRDHSKGYHKALYNYLILYDFDRAVEFLGQFTRADYVRLYVDEAKRRKVELASQSGRGEDRSPVREEVI
jgi:hypothetical protein